MISFSGQLHTHTIRKSLMAPPVIGHASENLDEVAPPNGVMAPVIQILDGETSIEFLLNVL